MEVGECFSSLTAILFPSESSFALPAPLASLNDVSNKKRACSVITAPSKHPSTHTHTHSAQKSSLSLSLSLRYDSLGSEQRLFRLDFCCCCCCCWEWLRVWRTDWLKGAACQRKTVPPPIWLFDCLTDWPSGTLCWPLTSPHANHFSNCICCFLSALCATFPRLQVEIDGQLPFVLSVK